MSHQSQINVNDVVRYKLNLARNQPGVVSTSADVTRGSYRVIFFYPNCGLSQSEKGNISIHVIKLFMLYFKEHVFYFELQV